MNKSWATVEGIRESIKWVNIFDVQFQRKFVSFSKNINHIGFGKDKKQIYITFTEFKYDSILRYLTDEIVHEGGVRILLYNRNGEPISVFEFTDCYLRDIAEIDLDYSENNNYLIDRKKYIAVISYSDIYKITD